MSGPPPKDPNQRARRNKDPNPTTVLQRGMAKPFPLPQELRACAGFKASDPCCPQHVRTRAWYRTWTTSPQAAEWLATDFLALLDTAYLVHKFYGGDTFVASEIRLRVSKWGATAEDRMRLRMTLAPVDDEPGHAPSARARGRARREYLSLVDEAAGDAVAGA